MWGAFAHCLISRALMADLPHNSHEEFRHVAGHLATEQNLARWMSDFGAAERLHIHFYHGNLTRPQFNTHARNTVRAIRDLLRVLQAGT